MVEATRRSALAEAREAGTFGANVQRPAVTLAERRPAALLRLCAAADDRDLADVVADTLGLELPRVPSTTNASDGRTLLWLAPRQWLLVCDDEQAAIAEQSLQAALDKTGATVVDVGHGYLVMSASGERAREVLSKGVPIDLDPLTFGVNACAQTCLADMNVLLHVRDAHAIDLYAGRSYAVSLWHWLCLSAAEYGYRVRDVRAR